MTSQHVSQNLYAQKTSSAYNIFQVSYNCVAMTHTFPPGPSMQPQNQMDMPVTEVGAAPAKWDVTCLTVFPFA